MKKASFKNRFIKVARIVCIVASVSMLNGCKTNTTDIVVLDKVSLIKNWYPVMYINFTNRTIGKICCKKNNKPKDCICTDSFAPPQTIDVNANRDVVKEIELPRIIAGNLKCL
jgi:hypothetical protein